MCLYDRLLMFINKRALLVKDPLARLIGRTVKGDKMNHVKKHPVWFMLEVLIVLIVTSLFYMRYHNNHVIGYSQRNLDHYTEHYDYIPPSARKTH